MNIFTIPFSNIRKKKTKTTLLVLVFSLGIMSIVALHQVSLVVGDSLEEKLSTYGANIIISPRSEKLRVSYGGFNMGEMLYDMNKLGEDETVTSIMSIGHSDRISVVAPKLVSNVVIGDVAVAVVGVRWLNELGIKSHWALTGTLPEQGDQLVMGARAAAALGVGVGDEVSFLDNRFEVAGVLAQTGGDDDQAVFMDLSTLQGLLGKADEVSFIEVAALCSGCPIDDIVAQIRTNLPDADVKALQNIVYQRMESINFVQQLALSISIVILVTAAAMIGLSMLSAVNERKKDIGILRSLGYAKFHVFTIFCLEAALIGLAAGVCGYLAGYGASFKALDILQFSDNFQPVFSAGQLIGSALLFACVALFAALYPAWKGAVTEPSQALVSI